MQTAEVGAIRRSLGYRPWECNLCPASFYSLEAVRAHFFTPFTQHPNASANYAESLDDPTERKVLAMLQAAGSVEKIVAQGAQGSQWAGEEGEEGEPLIPIIELQTGAAGAEADESDTTPTADVLESTRITPRSLAASAAKRRRPFLAPPDNPYAAPDEEESFDEAEEPATPLKAAAAPPRPSPTEQEDADKDTPAKRGLDGGSVALAALKQISFESEEEPETPAKAPPAPLKAVKKEVGERAAVEKLESQLASANRKPRGRPKKPKALAKARSADSDDEEPAKKSSKKKPTSKAVVEDSEDETPVKKVAKKKGRRARIVDSSEDSSAEEGGGAGAATTPQTKVQIKKEVFGASPTDCAQCGAAVGGSGTSQRRHVLRTHMGPLPYRCKVCPKTLENQSEAERHGKSTRAHRAAGEGDWKAGFDIVDDGKALRADPDQLSICFPS